MVTEMVRAHEVAHQWFGNKVGWNTYHDQWLSEAFANYAGAMYIEQKYKEPARLREILEEARRRILDKAPDGTVYDSVGPIWLGQRLSSTAVPNGYGEVTYAKGTWIVHMLRMLMRSEGGSDDNFFKMVRDLLNPSDGNSVSTWDLKRLVEKYQSKTMDIRSDKKMDWFFDQWILQTGIPSYALEYKVRADGKAFVVEGRITQSGVPDNFIMPLPLYADDQLLGTVVVSDDQGSFRFNAKNRPSKVTIDPHLTVLAQIQN
jgi:aminopeptidase N